MSDRPVTGRGRATISVDPEVLAFAEEEVRAGRAPSVSAVFETAIKDRMSKRARMRAWLDRELAAARERDPHAFAASERKIRGYFEEAGDEADDQVRKQDQS